VVSALFGAPRSASAQTPAAVPATDLFFGYQALHVPGQNYPVGFVVGMSAGATAVRLVGAAGVAIDSHSTPATGTLTLYHYGAGPRVGLAIGRVNPYAQVLVGGVTARADRTSSPAGAITQSNSAFMVQPGVGVAVAATRTFGFVGEFSFRRVFFTPRDNEESVFAGVRVAFR
jgi:hypothetical protein